MLVKFIFRLAYAAAALAALEGYNNFFPAYQTLTLSILYDWLIPALSGACLLDTVRLGLTASASEPQYKRDRLAMCWTAGLFCFSCFYRALNIADEGAGMCWGRPTVFNAPVSGRFVATIGEIALVVEVAVHTRATAERLKATRSLFGKVFAPFAPLHLVTILPVVLAESCSWCGVIMGDSRWFCAEYMVWVYLAVVWSWDGAVLFKHSITTVDKRLHGCLFIAGVALALFTFFHEVRHYFFSGAPLREVHDILRCEQAAPLSLWVARLPFFVSYFVMGSWCTLALARVFLDSTSTPRANVPNSKRSSKRD